MSFDLDIEAAHKTINILLEENSKFRVELKVAREIVIYQRVFLSVSGHRDGSCLGCEILKEYDEATQPKSE